MIQELLYTSHEGAGLRKGTGGGFCTVLGTEGMASNLVAALEKLSGYKHPYDVHDPKSKHNPVNYRHAVMRIGGISYHVLSRIADHRYEHTGRSNKLAHHVAITKDDLPTCGPAALCLQSDFFRNSWDGQVRLEPAPKLNCPPTSLRADVCHRWQTLAGDAGWGGVVAEHLKQSPSKPLTIIYPLGTDVIDLVAESLALLPPTARWEATFSTFFTSLPAGTSCTLRAVLADTPEADKLIRDPREKIINLTGKLDRAAGGPLVSAARDGSLVHEESKATRPRRQPNQPPVAAKETPKEDSDDFFDVTEDDIFGDAKLGPPVHRQPKRPEKQPRSAPTRSNRETARETGRTFTLGAIVVGVILAVVTLLAVTGAGIMLARAFSQPEIAPFEDIEGQPANRDSNTDPNRKNKPTNDPPPEDAANKPAGSNGEGTLPPTKTDGPPPETSTDADPAVNDPDSDATKNQPPEKPEPATTGETGLAEHSNNHGNKPEESPPPTPKAFSVPPIIELPEYVSSSDEQPLLKIPKRLLPVEDLTVLALDKIKIGNNRLRSEGEKITLRPEDDFLRVAQFRATDQGIVFRWGGENDEGEKTELKGNEPLLAAGLRWCVISFRVKDQTYHCRLSSPRQIPSISLPENLGSRFGSQPPDVELWSFMGDVHVANEDFFDSERSSTHSRSAIKIKSVEGLQPEGRIEIVQLKIELPSNPDIPTLEAKFEFRPIDKLLRSVRSGTELNAWESAEPLEFGRELKKAMREIAAERQRLEIQRLNLEREIKSLNPKKIVNNPELVAQLPIKIQQAEDKAKELQFLDRIEKVYRELMPRDTVREVRVTRAIIQCSYAYDPAFENVPDDAKSFPLIVIGDADPAKQVQSTADPRHNTQAQQNKPKEPKVPQITDTLQALPIPISVTIEQ